MKTLKKFLSIFCIFTLLATNLLNVKVSYATTVDTTLNSVYYDFEGYQGNENRTIDSVKDYAKTWGLQSKWGLSSSLGVADAETDRGTSLDIIMNSGADSSYPYLGVEPCNNITTSGHLAFSLKLGDTSRGRAVRMMAVNWYILKIIPGSGVTFMDKSLSSMSVVADKWYDIDIKFNKNTGYYLAIISCNGVTETLEGVHNNIKNYNFTGLRFLMWGGSSSVDNHTSLDDLTIEQIPDFYKSLKYENDFNSFVSSADGTNVPSGFNADGVSAGVNGFYSSDGQLQIKTSSITPMSLTLPVAIPSGLSVNVYGTLRAMADFSVSDKNADRAFFMGTKEVLTFGSDGNIHIGDLAVPYETNTSYDISIKLDTSANSAVAYVYNGSALIASGESSLEAVDFTAVTFKTTGTSSTSEAFIDNFNIYTDNGLFLSSSSPKSCAVGIKPCDVTATFSNQIKSLSYATLNGDDVAYSISGNNVTLAVKSDLEYGTDYTLVLGEAEDIFGEKKTFTITFSTIKAKVLSSITISSDAQNVKAKISGISNDGGDYSYKFILAKFDGNTNKLLDAEHDTFVLSSAETECKLSVSSGESCYYEAYLWDNLSSMNAVSDKAVLGTEPFADVTAGDVGFTQNMDTGVVTGSRLGINTSGTSTLIVFKPGKNMSHLASASSLTDVVDFIKQFDKSGKDVFSYTPSAGNGLYSYSLDAVFTSDAFDYIDPSYITGVYEAINSDGISFVECIGTYNKILTCDVTELSALSSAQKAEVDSLILNEREALSDGFKTIISFQNAYYKSLAFVILKSSTDASLVQSAVEKYGSYFDLESFTAYKTYTESNNTAKAEVYASLAATSLSDRETFEEIDEIFSPASVLAAIRNSQTQQQVGNIINDNNDTYLNLDFSGYNKITNKFALHTSLLAVPVDSLSAFKPVFYSAVSDRLELEAAEKDISDGVPVLGNSVIYDFEEYTGNDTTLSLTNLQSYDSGLSGGNLVDGVAGPTSVKTDRGTSLNLVNKSVAVDEHNYAVLYVYPKSTITGTAQFKLSVQYKELNRGNSIKLRGPSSDNQPAAAHITQDGSVSAMQIFGNTTVMKPVADKWYDFDFKINVATGYYEASVTCEGTTETFKGVHAGIQNLSELRYIQFGYGGKRQFGTQTNIWYDDVLLKEIDPLYISYTDEEDFSLFNQASGGTTVPEGFTSQGVVNAKNGFYTSDGILVMKTTVPGTLSLDKAYSFGSYAGIAYGTMRTDLTLNIADANADRTIKISDQEIASFTSDGQFVVGSAKTSYTIGKDYKLVIKASPKAITADRGETYYNVVTVLLYDGSNLVFNGTKNIPTGKITETSLLVLASAEPSDTYVKEFNVYTDNGFYISSSSPYNYETNVIPDNSIISFSNALEFVQKVTLNGSNVDFSIEDNTLKANIKSKLLYNTKYTLNIVGAKDIFGETKDFTITFYTSFASKLSDIQIKDSANITASVSGYSYDGNKYSYVLMLAKFDGTSNKLLGIEKTNITLNSSNKEFTVSIPKTEDAYYEAYVWDSIKGMVAIKDKASFGTNALANVKEGTTGYIQNMDTLTVTATNTGISGEGRNSLLILKPGKNMSHLTSASSLTDVIDYIAQFDNAKADVYSYTPANGGGKYGVSINADFKPEAFTYLASSYIAEALAAVNSDGANYVDCIGNYNDVYNVDTTELSQFTSDEKARLNTLVTEEKEKLTSGFTTVALFENVYNTALARAIIENADSGSDVKTAFEKYGLELGIKNFTAYDAYSGLSDTAKGLIYSDIANTGDLSTLLKIENAFADSAILRAVRYADNYVEINNIITDNNSYLLFDLSTYNSLTHQSDVNKALIGKSFENIAAFKTAFANAVAAQKSAENSSKSPSPIGGSTSTSGAVTLGPVETVAPLAYFTDLGNYAWAKDAIETLAKEGIVSGKATGIFDPASNITREEFTKIIVNAFVGVDDNLECSFTDVAMGSWYYPYVATAQKLGIINGTSSSTFGTGENITRQDMAAILYRTAQMCGIYLEKGLLTFDDSQSVTDYAKDAIGALSLSGIINGKGNNMFEPVAFATRAESAKMVYGLLERGDN